MIWGGAPNFCPKNDFDELTFALEINWLPAFFCFKKTSTSKNLNYVYLSYLFLYKSHPHI